ncbi:MAG: hypothetical protein ABIT05_08880 [Chitinophagaceae bacterium]
MYQELYQFLLQHKQLPVPGIGTFLLERKPALIDFPNRKIDPPIYSVALTPVAGSPSSDFFAWLADTFHISGSDAVTRFNDFVFGLKKQVTDGDTIKWDGIGTLSKGLAGEIKFTPVLYTVLEKPVAAEKVIREKSAHMVRVGEDEKTSAEMTEMLNKPEEKKSYWWVPAVAVILLAVMFIGWYFSEHGVGVSSTANDRKLVPEQATATYRILP